MIRPKHIFLRLLLVVIPLLMAMAPAIAQNTVYAGQQKDLGVEPIAGDTYVWELYTDNTSINFATEPGNCPASDAYFVSGSTGPVVTVMWVTPGTYYFKVTAYRNACVMNVKIGQMTVLHELPTAVIDPPDPLCIGSTTNLIVHLTGTAPWSITYTDGTTPATINGIMSSPFNLPVSPTVTTSYTITSVTDAYGTNNIPSNTVTLIVKPLPVTNPIWHN
ncbi:MAG: hypothetical protein WCK09_20420 [Bacteroidota bacterium]